VAAIVPFAMLSSAATKRLGRIQAQLADTLMVIASAMRPVASAGAGQRREEIDEPAASEFAQVLAEVRLGRHRRRDGRARRACRQHGSRVDRDRHQDPATGRRNLAEVLETVAKTIRERETLRRQVKVLSAEGRLSMVVSRPADPRLGVPMFVNPDYLRILTNTRPGVVILSGAGV
jgi:tight adherence protein B